MWKKVDKLQAEGNAIGFWTPRVGEVIEGKVKGEVTSKKYPFFVFILSANGGQFTSQEGVSNGSADEVCFLPKHIELEVLGDMIGKKVRITFVGREKLEGGKSICRYTIEEDCIATEDGPF